MRCSECEPLITPTPPPHPRSSPSPERKERVATARLGSLSITSNGDPDPDDSSPYLPFLPGGHLLQVGDVGCKHLGAVDVVEAGQ